MLQTSATKSLLGEYQSYSKQSYLVLEKAQTILKPGDNVILSTGNNSFQDKLEKNDINVYSFDAKNKDDFDHQLLQILDHQCVSSTQFQSPNAYFIWTQDNKNSIMNLGPAAREMNFYFTFQAVFPYQGSDVFIIDKVLRLFPKEKILNRYCEAKRLIENNQAVIIIDKNDFSPWIGSINTSSITWLANNPIRQMKNSDFAVINMPPMITYDVFWMGQLYSEPSWSFKNQDHEAYGKAIENIKKAGGIILKDKGLPLGSVASQYLNECMNNQVTINSPQFEPLCLQ